MLAEDEAQHIVALKLDRIFRSVEDALKWVQDFEQRGLTLHLADMGGQNLNTQTAMGRMMLLLLASCAEFEKNLVGERTASALQLRKANRQVYGHPPYGFDVSADKKNLIPNEREQKVLEQIFAWRADGLSLAKVTGRLNDLGVPSKKGGKWHPATVAHIVNNDLYREGAENLVPWPPGGKKRESAEARLIGQIIQTREERQ
jgi:DNA invertase Pin-like site-specific DNA recombinase